MRVWGLSVSLKHYDKWHCGFLQNIISGKDSVGVLTGMCAETHMGCTYERKKETENGRCSADMCDVSGGLQ